MPIKPFWTWCDTVGITHVKLLLSRSGGADRFSVLDTIPSGTVIANIPFRAAIAAQSVPLGALPKRFPPLSVFSLALQSLNPTKYEVKCSWLAVMLATLVERETGLHLPYIGMFSPLGQLDIRRQRLLDQLSEGERQTYDGLIKDQRRFAKHAHRLASRCFRAPPFEAFQWAHDVVIQRGVTIPSYCAASAPEPVGDFLRMRESGVWEIPALVPIVDSLDFTRLEANCELYTCHHQNFVGDSTVVRGPKSIANLTQKRRVVVCASRDIKAGEVLSAPSCLDIDRATCLFRFGELPEVPQATKETTAAASSPKVLI